MKTLIFKLFIFFSIIFNSFAAMYDDILDQTAQPPRTNSAGLLVLTEADFETNAPSPTTNLSAEFVWLAEEPVVAKKPLRIVFLDEEPVVATEKPTNALKPWEMDWSDTWVDEEPVVSKGITLNIDIPPPITNDFNVIFPKLFSSDNRLIMTNATYSGINGRTLTFTQFSSTGCRSLNLDITNVHFRILEYLKLTNRQRLIIKAEIEERKKQEWIAEYNRIEAVVIEKERNGVPLSGDLEKQIMRNVIRERAELKARLEQQAEFNRQLQLQENQRLLQNIEDSLANPTPIKVYDPKDCDYYGNPYPWAKPIVIYAP